VSRVWYCATCGYEVDGGGRCHRCKERLLSSPLAELAEGETDDEVGYRLTGWEDRQRGELIEALIDNEVRHRFEGDELVVAGDDEAVADEIVAELGARSADGPGDPDATGEADEATVEALEALLDAARRLRADPTDMNADGDLAEASIGVLAVDDVYGVDDETWSAIGRVTRRLLAALGDDVALEDDIATQASVLCRLLEPIVSPQAGDGVPWSVGLTAYGRVASYHPPAPAQAEPPMEDEPDEGDEDATGTLDGGDEVFEGDEVVDRHEVVYELGDWLPEERVGADLVLDREGIAHRWEGTDLVVADVEWDRVDALLDTVHPSLGAVLEPEADDPGDEREYQALSELFAAADRLAGDPDNKAKRKALLEAAGAVTGGPTPFGMSDDQWWQIRTRAGALTDYLEIGAGPDVVRGSATTLRELMRGFV
jgi:hypothetical protein